MKIIIDARLYGLENAGLGRYVMNLTEELKKLKTKKHFIILLRKKYFNSLEFPDNWKKVLADFRHYGLAEQLKLPWILLREKPDLVHFPHFNIPVLYIGKYVVTIHDLLMHKQKGLEATTLPFYKYYPKRLAYRFIFNQAVRKSKKIIVPSLAVKKELKNTYKIDGNKITVTYEGVDRDITRYSKRISTILNKYGLNSDYLIYVGNAYPHKNLTLAIEAVKELNESGEKLVFAIASSRNIFTNRLGKIIKKLNAQDSVRLLGFVPDRDYGPLLRKAITFVSPSLSEGFGLPGLEAMAVGTPVIASDIPIFREIYRDNAVYFNPRDKESLKKTIIRIMSMSADERNKRIIRAREFVKKYSWSKMARETVEIYRGARL